MSTRLLLSGWVIEPDDHGWTLFKQGVVKKGASRGRLYKERATYFPRLQQALEALQDHVLAESDARSVDALLEALQAFRKELQALWALMPVELAP